MPQRFTRRQLAAAVAATPLLAQAPTRPEAPPQPNAAARTSEPPADPIEKARQQSRQNAEAIAKVQLGMAVEPSFAFKP